MKSIRHIWTQQTIKKINGPDLIDEDLSYAKLSGGFFSNGYPLAGVLFVFVLAAVYYITYRRFHLTIDLLNYGLIAASLVTYEAAVTVAMAPRSLPFVIARAMASIYGLGYAAYLLEHLTGFKYTYFMSDITFPLSLVIIGISAKLYFNRCREILTVNRSVFEFADAPNSLWWDATVLDCAFDNTNLREAKFNIATITDCHIVSSNLYGTTFDKAAFYRTRFDQSSFRWAKLKSSAFHDCIFDNTDLHGTNFGDTKFERVSFRDVDIGSANFLKASFSKVDFTRVTANKLTKWPTGFNPAHAGINIIDELILPAPAQVEETA